MDWQFWIMVIKIIIFLPFIILLIIISAKIGSNKLQKLQEGKYIKVIERAALSKENNLLVVKIGEKGYVISSTKGKVEILLEVSDEDIKKIESSKQIPQYDSLKDFLKKNDLINNFYKKVKGKKEDKYD